MKIFRRLKLTYKKYIIIPYKEYLIRKKIRQCKKLIKFISPIDQARLILLEKDMEK